MNHHAFGMPTINERCLQCIFNKQRVNAATHLPTHNLPAEQVLHDGKVEPAFIGADIRDVSDPHLIEFGKRKLPVR